MPLYENIQVVGMNFRGSQAKNLTQVMDEGQTLQLEREPDNKFDDYAVKVNYLAANNPPFHLGYINAADAAFIGTKMDELEIETINGTVTGFQEIRKNLHPLMSISIEAQEKS